MPSRKDYLELENYILYGSPQPKIIIKTEEELRDLDIFDILYDVFGTTKPNK